MTNDGRTHHLLSGCHVAVGNVALQMVILGVIGCMVVVLWCGVVPGLVMTWMVTILGMLSPSDKAARPEGTVDVLLHHPGVGARWVGDVVWPHCWRRGRRSLSVSGDGWDGRGRWTHHRVHRSSCGRPVQRGTFPSSSSLLWCGVDMAGARSLGDVVSPHRSHSPGCRRWMWTEVGVVDGDDSVTVAGRQWYMGVINSGGSG
jgi:hypothetical protein